MNLSATRKRLLGSFSFSSGQLLQGSSLNALNKDEGIVAFSVAFENTSNTFQPGFRNPLSVLALTAFMTRSWDAAYTATGNNRLPLIPSTIHSGVNVANPGACLDVPRVGEILRKLVDGSFKITIGNFPIEVDLPNMLYLAPAFDPTIRSHVRPDDEFYRVFASPTANTGSTTLIEGNPHVVWGYGHKGTRGVFLPEIFIPAGDYVTNTTRPFAWFPEDLGSSSLQPTVDFKFGTGHVKHYTRVSQTSTASPTTEANLTKSYALENQSSFYDFGTGTRLVVYAHVADRASILKSSSAKTTSNWTWKVVRRTVNSNESKQEISGLPGTFGVAKMGIMELESRADGYSLHAIPDGIDAYPGRESIITTIGGNDWPNVARANGLDPNAPGIFPRRPLAALKALRSGEVELMLGAFLPGPGQVVQYVNPDLANGDGIATIPGDTLQYDTDNFAGMPNVDSVPAQLFSSSLTRELIIQAGGYVQ